MKRRVGLLVETEQLLRAWIGLRAGEIPLADDAAEWMDKVRLAPRTGGRSTRPNSDRTSCQNGGLDLVDITPEVVRGWYADLLVERGASVAAKAYVRLKQVLGQAVNDDRIAKNPCRIANGGAERHAEQRFATLSELYSLAAAAPDRYRALILTAGLAGLRIGELSALRRKDVDVLHGRIYVRRKRVRLASGEVIEGDPKSEAGRRTVALPETLLPELERHLDNFAEHRVTAMFTRQNGGPIDRNNFRSRVWIPSTKAVGMKGLGFTICGHTAGHARGAHRRYDEGTDGPPGPREPACRAHLPTRNR